jgi:hypothetical protein
MPTGEPSPTEVRFAAMLKRIVDLETRQETQTTVLSDFMKLFYEFKDEVMVRFKDMDLRIQLAGELSQASTKRGKPDPDKEAVFNFMKANPGIRFTPSLVHVNMQEDGYEGEYHTVSNKLTQLHQNKLIEYQVNDKGRGSFYYKKESNDGE